MTSMIASSFKDNDTNSFVLPTDNGFVRAAFQAYNNHHHLVIRPEDVWFSILTQFSMYVNANAEKLRDKFVAHQGQEELAIWVIETPDKIDYGAFFYKMGKLIEANVVDPELRNWILPAFTTTTKQDQAIASAIFMGSMQNYFTYKACCMCGLPSVTLLGEKSDWETILFRLEKLQSFGNEPTTWYSLLKPVIQHFIRTFDSPNAPATRDFWQKICHHSGGGSGPSYLSGWLTAFAFWDADGVMQYKAGSNPPPWVTEFQDQMGNTTPILVLDGVRYHRVELDDIPIGFVATPLKIEDPSGTLYNARILAGSIGMRVTSSGGKIAEFQPNLWGHKPPEMRKNSDGGVLDTVQPESGWFVYLVRTKEEQEKYEIEQWRKSRALGR